MKTVTTRIYRLDPFCAQHVQAASAEGHLYSSSCRRRRCNRGDRGNSSYRRLRTRQVDDHVHGDHFHDDRHSADDGLDADFDDYQSADHELLAHLHYEQHEHVDGLEFYDFDDHELLHDQQLQYEQQFQYVEHDLFE